MATIIALFILFWFIQIFGLCMAATGRGDYVCVIKYNDLKRQEHVGQPTLPAGLWVKQNNCTVTAALRAVGNLLHTQYRQ
jgi:hypothetical protein